MLGRYFLLVGAIMVKGQETQLAGGMRQFTNKLLQNIETSEDSNFVVSPYSLHSVFTGLLIGSRGQTRSELRQLLGISGEPNTLNRYQAVTRGLVRGKSKVQVSNMVALAKGFKPKLNYTSTLSDVFEAEVEEFDFESQGAESVRQINNYVSGRTNNKIKELLSEDDVDSLTRLILVNAVYFKGVWKNLFEPEDTFNTGFTSSTNRGVVDTPFMSMEANLRLMDDEDNGIEILELPYSDPSKSMLFVLPKPNHSSANLTKRISGLDLRKIRDLPELETVVSVPKFTLKYQTPLKEKITNIGASRIFSQAADLSHISDLPLYVSGGVHQAFIEVNEEGTKAAAATAVQVGLRTARRRRQFFADRPFLFIVYDFKNNVTLFAGKVVDPSSPVLIQRKASLPLQEIPIPQSQNSANTGQKVTQNADTKACSNLLRDFPNALDNLNICRKVAEEGKFLDWLRNNRQLCEESKDHYDTFTAGECEPVWCQVAAKRNEDAWRREKRERCAVINDSNKQDCKNIDNKIKAISFLNCQL